MGATKDHNFLHDLVGFSRDLKLLAAANFAWAAGEALFIYITPLYLQQLGGTPVQIGNIISLVGVAMASATIPAGILADRWGAKPVMWIGWLIGLSAGVFMAAASSLTWFSVGWILYSTTMFVGPAISGYAVASRGNLPPERALTFISAAYGLGNVVSPALGGLLAARFGIRSLFIGGVAMFAVSTVLIYFMRAEPVARAAAPGRFFDLLVNRRFAGFCALVLAVWVALYMGIPLGPNYLASVRGLSVARVSTLGTFNALGWVILNLVVGRRAPRRMYIFAQALMMVYLVLMLRASWFGWLIVAYFARSSLHTAYSLVHAQATRIVKRSQTSQAFGVLSTLGWGGSAIAPLLAGRLYAVNPALPFQLGLLLLPVTMLLTYFLAPRPGADSAGLEGEPRDASSYEVADRGLRIPE
jgi:MFS family permease